MCDFVPKNFKFYDLSSLTGAEQSVPSLNERKSF